MNSCPTRISAVESECRGDNGGAAGSFSAASGIGDEENEGKVSKSLKSLGRSLSVLYRGKILSNIQQS